MGIEVTIYTPVGAPASPDQPGEALSRDGGYQPPRWSPASLALTAAVQSVPVLVALWVWQPALVQVAPAASLAVFDVAPPETPAEEPAPEPEKPSETPPAEEAPAPLAVIAAPAPVTPKIVIPAALAMLAKAAPVVEAQPAPPPRPAPSTPSEKPADWQARVLGRLNAVKSYPVSARARRQQGVAMIRFTLDRKGNVLDVALAQSSGFALLDREALALPKRASPLPAPPDDMKGEKIELLVPVEFHF